MDDRRRGEAGGTNGSGGSVKDVRRESPKGKESAQALFTCLSGPAQLRRSGV